MTVETFKDVCQSMKINMSKLNYKQSSGMISNACMSPNCVLYMQPLTRNEFSDHMRLWKKTMPARFHMEVAAKLKQKVPVNEIYNFLINSGHVKLDKHHKSKEEVMEYIELIKNSLGK